MIEVMPRNPATMRPKMTNADALAMLYVLLRCHRLTLAVFMRHSFGTRAFDPHGAFGFFFLLSMAGVHPVFRLYLALWVIAMGAHRFYSYRLRWSGQEGHTQYQGWPWLALKWPGVKDETNARRLEPMICLFGGLVLATISEPLGLFVLAGFVSFGGCLLIDWLADTQRLLSLKDGELEMRYYAEKWRERR